MTSKTQLSLKGLQFNPIGDILVTFKKTGDKFMIERAKTSVHNFIVGSMYVWNHGEMYCKNLMTNEIAVLNLLPKGWTSK